MLVKWQVGAAENVIGDPRGIFGDSWQRLRPRCRCFRRCVLKKCAHPFFHFVAGVKTAPMQFGVAMTCGVPIGIAREFVAKHARAAQGEGKSLAVGRVRGGGSVAEQRNAIAIRMFDPGVADVEARERADRFRVGALVGNRRIGFRGLADE